IGAFIAAFFMVRGNLAALRGDIRGAVAVIGVALFLGLVSWVLVAHHVTDAAFRQGMGASLFGAAMLFALYLALEPQARRHWPQTLITWSRVMTGRYRDPLVGRDLLLGAAFGIGYSLLYEAYQFTVSRFGIPPTTEFWPGLLGGVFVP